jgi:hypothetical protein
MTRNQIIENLFTGKNFNDCLAKMEPAHLRDDLKMEVISIVCEWPEEKIIQLHKDKAIEFYVVRVILNQVKSKTSDFVRKYRSTNTYEIAKDPADVTEDTRDREIKESLEDIALEEIDRLYWYDAEMIRLYLKLKTFRAIEEHTGIPYISCYKNIQKSLITLKKKAIEKAEPIFKKEELKFIQNDKKCRDI